MSDLTRKPLLLLSTICTLFCCARLPNELTITHIANNGVFLSSPQGNVLYDALYDQGHGIYMIPDAQLRKQMIDGESPFQQVDLYLVSHQHIDHFYPPYVAEFLAQHQEARLAASPQVCDSLRNTPDIAGQVCSIQLELGGVIDTVLQNIPIKIYRTRHVGETDGATMNYAFLLTINGLKILLPGDGPFDNNLDLYSRFNLEQEQIDILFIEFFEYSESTQVFVRNVLKPKHIIVMHIPEKNYEEDMAKFLAAFPGAIIFSKPMESRVFNKAGLLKE
ncbi:MAG TPA: MBL fold metallo-hydrolase [bacterium]|nr:MBL fold metallo-hydrolase [bacterium]HPN45855.1 MBL fold metallo-hydrolase [bacterium]